MALSRDRGERIRFLMVGGNELTRTPRHSPGVLLQLGGGTPWRRCSSVLRCLELLKNFCVQALPVERQNGKADHRSTQGQQEPSATRVQASQHGGLPGPTLRADIEPWIKQENADGRMREDDEGGGGAANHWKLKGACASEPCTRGSAVHQISFPARPDC